MFRVGQRGSIIPYRTECLCKLIDEIFGCCVNGFTGVCIEINFIISAVLPTRSSCFYNSSARIVNLFPLSEMLRVWLGSCHSYHPYDYGLRARHLRTVGIIMYVFTYGCTLQVVLTLISILKCHLYAPKKKIIKCALGRTVVTRLSCFKR